MLKESRLYGETKKLYRHLLGQPGKIRRVLSQEKLKKRLHSSSFCIILLKYFVIFSPFVKKFDTVKRYITLSVYLCQKGNTMQEVCSVTIGLNKTIKCPSGTSETYRKPKLIDCLREALRNAGIVKHAGCHTF